MVLAGFYISLFLTRQNKVTIQLKSQPDKLLPEAQNYSNVSVTGETETERTGRIAAANLMEQLVFVHISPFP